MMNTQENTKAALIAGTLTLLAPSTPAAENSSTVEEIVARIKSPDDTVRTEAWQAAGMLGAPAVKPLAAVMAGEDFEIARAAKRGLWKVVRYAGRPGTRKEKAAVQKALLALLPEGPVPVRREVLWMLSEIGDDDALKPMAALLKDKELREDARCALLRLPGKKVTSVLKSAFESAEEEEEFKFALAESLRIRGEVVASYPCKKVVPAKQTTIVPKKVG
ncbi:MAG: hypothetical protein WCO56_26290 [Verrucomicrobiota bacterium]